MLCTVLRRQYLFGKQYFQRYFSSPCRKHWSLSANKRDPTKHAKVCYSCDYSVSCYEQRGRDRMYDAILFEPKCRRLKMVKIPQVTSLRDYEVLIQVAYAGIRGADIRFIEGPQRPNTAPVVAGREMSGVVSKVGACVRHVKPGDKVVLYGINACYRCSECTRGALNHCQVEGERTAIGYLQNGSWAEYCIVHQNNVFKLPSSVSLIYGILADVLDYVVNLMTCISQLPSPFARTLIIGAGLKGTLMATLLQYQEYTCVTISDVSEERCKLATKRFEPVGYNVVSAEKVGCTPETNRLDLVVNCSGDMKEAEKGLTLLRPGGKLVLCDEPSGGDTFKVSPYKIYYNEYKIIGAKNHPFAFPDAIEWINTLGPEYLDFSALGIRTYELRNYTKALQAVRSKRVLKAVFEFDKNKQAKSKKEKCV